MNQIQKTIFHLKMCLFFHEITLFSHHFPFFCSLIKAITFFEVHQPQNSMLRLLEWVGGGGWEGSIRMEICFIKATKMVQFQVTIIK